MGIFVNDLLKSRLLELKLRLLKTMLLQLLRHKIVLGDFQFFLCKITAYIDHLHTVLEGRLDGLDIIGRRDEKHIRQIIIYIQIIIMECSILLRIKRFQKSRRRISLYILGKFIHLIEDDDRIGSTRTVDTVQDTSGQSTYVCLSVTADLRLIMHTAESDTYIFTSQSTCYGLSQTGLADSRRAIQTQDRRLHIAFEFQHSQILDNSFLYLVQPVVVFIQHPLRMLQVEIILGHFTPRKIQHELNVIILYAVIW